MNMLNDPMRVQSDESRMWKFLHDNFILFVCKQHENKEEASFLKLREIQKYQSNVICGPCLDPDFQKSCKNTFLRQLQKLYMDWVLDSIKALLFILLGMLKVCVCVCV